VKITHYRWFSAAGLAPAILLASCASTTMRSVQSAPNFQATQIHKALVIGLMKTPGLRKVFEDEFVRQWRARGVSAMASLDVLPPGTTLDKNGVAPFAKAQGYDVVLVTRLLDRHDIDRAVHVQTFQKSNSDSNPWEDDNDLTQDLKVVVASPQYDINYALAIVSTNIYDVPTEQRIWAGITETVVTGDVVNLVRPFSKVILKNIYARS